MDVIGRAATLYRKRGFKRCFFISQRKVTFEQATKTGEQKPMAVAVASQASRSCKNWLARGHEASGRDLEWLARSRTGHSVHGSQDRDGADLASPSAANRQTCC